VLVAVSETSAVFCVTVALLDTEPDTATEDEEPEDEEAVILNGKEYWKVDGSESRVSLKP
jgi:hypothetical protein